MIARDHTIEATPMRPEEVGSSQEPFEAAAILRAVEHHRLAVQIIRDRDGRVGLASATEDLPPGAALVALLPPVLPERLGDPTFCKAHGLALPYAVGAMAHLLTSEEMVIAAGRAGLLSFLGTAGVPMARVAECVDTIERGLGEEGAWGCNLIHTPGDPQRELELVQLLLSRGVRRVCASAFSEVSPAAVLFAASGLRVGGDGRIVRRNHLFAKLSRPEVAAAFCRAAPRHVLDELVAAGRLDAEEAQAAARIPLASDITVEGDSGGHTDNQNTLVIVPVIAALAQRAAREHGHDTPVRVGAAGGLGTPAAVAAAFAAGAAYVLTGSVNQSARECPLSTRAKTLLAGASPHDVGTAPSGDMFESGARVQVLKRGTLFASRARRLQEAYLQHESLEAIPPQLRERLEREVLGARFTDVWATTRTFFQQRDPSQLERAERDPKHRMALVFRWYLGMASRWAIQGEASRALDFQIWSGPAIGAFNGWVAGSFLEPLENRTVAEIAFNLLEGAAAWTRAQQLRTAGVPVPAAAFQFIPRRLAASRTEAGHERR